MMYYNESNFAFTKLINETIGSFDFQEICANAYDDEYQKQTEIYKITNNKGKKKLFLF